MSSTRDDLGVRYYKRLLRQLMAGEITDKIFHNRINRYSRLFPREWAGMPIPISNFDLVLHKSYGHLENEIQQIKDIIDQRCFIAWKFSRRLDRFWAIVGPPGKKRLKVCNDKSCDYSISFFLNTMVVAKHWDYKAELKAIQKLCNLIKQQQMKQYMLTGAFTEISDKSNVMYIFRKLRPTMALSRTGKPLTCLCMHPMGFYRNSFAGCLVPTDDVISHLLLMRSDERRFWGKCNQHPFHRPEAGV